ncbi:dialkylresorcinol condensing enzyme DarA [Myroides sp. 1354]|uniref:flavodoxin n=1 Tax=unclassified Myroides TaxID=2642485 RepID=UPI002577F4CE|nr:MULTISPECIES: dialkylrecorsinol condensing enzyme DarA [unclassified Myroides]MDM1043662.1 dialkylresorcinol condensing enzyme DarA [Myroides sp. R163-1]MDM1054288.1 dialkylresorcinol condensing enzyme DarA [Myroides sp. 1354]MDM1067584.1 dialkylresorcinol condensing enzyme DarA [Myroides sp. 1372]
MKRVLVIYYSQSGQLKQVLDQLVSPLVQEEAVDVTWYEIEMEQPYGFPWKKADFFDAFPESFKQIEQPILPPSEAILAKKYDLVVLGYQVWYLTPSIPINSFMKSAYAQQLLADTPVVTVSGSRNMWVMAQEKLKKQIQAVQGLLVGNIALVDRNINLVSVITIVDWMFSGKKRNVYGILPKPGIAPEEILASKRFGETIRKYLYSTNYQGLQEELIQQNAVEVRHFLVSMDRKANRLFGIWSALILKNSPQRRPFLLKCFNVYLFVAIWLISPIVHLIHILLYPLNYKKIQRDKTYFQGIK